MTTKYTLGIETSCDDTSVSLLKNAQVVATITNTTQNKMCKFGGIIPEIAARGHAESLYIVLDKLQRETKIKLSRIDQICYTALPGLPGSLHTGKVCAKTIAYLTNKKIIPINHMLGHVFSFAINTDKKIIFPFICLVVSGGHTTIYLFNDLQNYQILNNTVDNPVGEVLDKIGKALKLPYPGGIYLDKQYQEDKTNFPLIKHYAPDDQFSFSGIRTFVINCINNQNKFNSTIIGSAVLKWVVDEIIIKLEYYTKKYHIKEVVLGGGVSANSLLRKKILAHHDWNIHLPELKYTGDNGAMIGFYGYLLSK